MRLPTYFARIVSALALSLVMLGLGRPAETLAAPAGDNSSTLKSALAKTASVSVYRLDMDMKAKGSFTSAFGGAGQEIPLLTLAGEINGKDAHIIMKGFFGSFLGVDPNRGLEIITVAGKSYVHGPASILGAMEPKWYILPASKNPESLSRPHDIGALAKADTSGFTVLGSEALDGRRCGIYGSTDKKVIVKTFESFGSGSQATGNLQDITAAELKFWICDDGYFHKMYMFVEGIDKTNPATKGAVKLSFHIFDFNAPIKIVAPANPAQLEYQDKVVVPFATQPLPKPQVPAGGWTASVVNGGNIRKDPSIKGSVLGQLHAGEVVTLARKTPNGRWYFVAAPAGTGWVSASLLKIDPAVARQVPIHEPAAQPKPANGALTATVFNGGNIRATPSLRGKVLGQIRAGEVVRLLAKNKNGVWYQVISSNGVTGWVNVTLLKIDPAAATKVPIK